MTSGNSIEKYDCFIGDSFSEEDFFKDILASCYQKKLLNDNDLANIYYVRMEVLKDKLKYYTKDESSSVRVEAAESILKCIDYTIGIYLKTFNNKELIIEDLKHTSLFDMLNRGQDLINKKILHSKKLLHEIKESKLQVDNYSYNDTIDSGISLFFKKYNSFFEAHETPGSIDYQLYIDDMNYIGIEYIYNYVSTLNLENEFCNKFNISEINKLLKAYDKNSDLLLINIFELALINSLGVIICNKDLNNLNINSLDRKYIKGKLGKLSLEELQKELLKYAKICCEILDIKNEALAAYIKISVLKIASLIKESIKLNRLETVFLSFNEENGDEIIQYTDGKKMANSEFKKLSEEIRECSMTENKIQLIKNNIKSLEDLFDMLSADCLFEDEYTMYFKSLSKMEIVLLSKYIYDLSLENEYAKEWYQQFNNYILSLSEEEQRKIKELEEKIQL
ncbi:hypothetical protein HBE96_07875 [Clostridium sp. P21]|uniref:Uncharacterized protein n=1 Tax=Clostridium muellerianum TaxID=2716538 RepID=A0A7Y0HP25_9CLOT|nr:DUF6179 domain-containing protein [Clostridium muellerianum]NMM62611.1 hypothetical protein [Clostridium muellerianum]